MTTTKLANANRILAFVVLFTLAACASGQAMINHSFSFDTRYDSPDAEVLDYQYGNSSQFGTHADKERVAAGQVFPQTSIFGQMSRGEVLYVKWRIKHTGQVYEDKVDLKDRLPENITDFNIHFVIRGPQLYVFLISPERRFASTPAGPVRKYAHLKQTQIYPGQPTQ